MARLDDMTAAEIGERLRMARAASGKTQEEACQALNVSRPTLISIEKGQRKAKLEEVEALADLYGVALNRLLARDALHVDLQAQFRRQGSIDDEARASVALLSAMATASVELERLLGVTFPTTYPPEQPLLPGKIERQAEDAALALRHRLGIGLAPVADVVSLMENELKIRIFIRPLPSRISGLFAYEPTVGACVLLNANHPWERRAGTLTHEVAHFLHTRSSPDVCESDRVGTSPEEKFATAFSLHFLMPPAALRRRFAEIIEGDRRFTPRHLVLLAQAFHVSSEAMCRQLERLELLPAGTYDHLKERGFNRDFVRGIVGDPAPPPERIPLSPHLAQLASSAHRRGLVTEGQLARMLALDRIAVREILDVFDGGEIDEIEIPLE